jgi:phospholipase C
MRRSIFPTLIMAFATLFVAFIPVDAIRSSKIKHIIVLMMENRSFDHLLGFLKADYNADIDGLTGKESLPRDPNDLTKGSVPVTRNGYDVSPDDPKHDFDNIATQLNKNKMDGFVFDSLKYSMNETNPVNMFDSTSAPIVNTLAKEFAVFDKWFCSLPSSTDPNRAFALSGTSEGIITNFNGTQWTQQSYFDYLVQHNRTVRGYYQDDLWVFGYFKDMHQENIAKEIFQLEPNFYNDMAIGNLADFTWIQPRTGPHGINKPPTWQHPDASVIEGERLIKQVYEAIRASPKWEETLFLITYDEHGGFADHVTPPYQGVPAPDDNVASNGFKFDQLGIRTPTIAISPWIAKGTIVHEGIASEQPTPTSAFESTSIMATSNIILGLQHAKPLGKRMAWANTFASLVDTQSTPRTDCPETLPELPTEINPEASYEKQIAKPLNEHLEGQLLLFCNLHYPELHAKNECPGRKEIMNTQGKATKWLSEQLEVFKTRVPLGQSANKK